MSHPLWPSRERGGVVARRATDAWSSSPRGGDDGLMSVKTEEPQLRSGSRQRPHGSSYSSPHLTKERTDLIDKEFRLFGCGKMTAPRELIPIAECRKNPFNPASRRLDELFGKARISNGHLDRNRWRRSETFPIQPCGRSTRIGEPVDHHIVQQLVPGKYILGVAVAVRPCLKLLEDPRGLPGRRVCETITERLRTR